MCVADDTLRDSIGRLAAELASVDIATQLERAIQHLSSEPCALAIIDSLAWSQAGNSLDQKLRLERELATALVNNRGGAQLIVLAADGHPTAFTGTLQTEEVGSRVSVIRTESVSREIWRTLFSLAIRQAERIPAQPASQISARPHSLRDVLGASPRMVELFTVVQEVALLDTPILVCGEQGTGTSLLTNAIHEESSRAEQPFVRVHSRSLTLESLNELLCASIGEAQTTPTLSLATLPRPVGGTLFLDDFDTLPVALHKPLCRFVARQQELADGSQGQHRPVVRIIAATHLNLDLPTRQTLGVEILTRGLNAQRIFVPPLRDRPEDIEPLAEQFFVRWALQEDQPRPHLTPEAVACLKQHLWPGNVRELYTVLRNAAILAVGTDLTEDLVLPWLANPEDGDFIDTPRMTLADMERQLIETTFARCGGNREKTAQSLDIGLRTLSGKLREYGYPPRGGPGSNLKVA